jgi:redox-sensitive bicupin YhaK (pirin superfamily)
VHSLGAGRLGWLQVARGSVVLNGQQLATGDGAAIDAAVDLTVAGASDDSEILLFDMAA